MQWENRRFQRQKQDYFLLTKATSKPGQCHLLKVGSVPLTQGPTLPLLGQPLSPTQDPDDHGHALHPQKELQ